MFTFVNTVFFLTFCHLLASPPLPSTLQNNILLNWEVILAIRNDLKDLFKKYLESVHYESDIGMLFSTTN